ncbi:MAG: hypothetical protein ACYTET_00835 [Planctomycetota bacterium]
MSGTGCAADGVGLHESAQVRVVAAVPVVVQVRFSIEPPGR